MSQGSVLDFLKENKSIWWDTPTLSKKLKISQGSIASNCFKLRKAKMVKFREPGINNNIKYFYRYKK